MLFLFQQYVCLAELFKTTAEFCHQLLECLGIVLQTSLLETYWNCYLYEIFLILHYPLSVNIFHISKLDRITRFFMVIKVLSKKVRISPFAVPWQIVVMKIRFWPPLKISENLWFPDVFRGIKSENWEEKALKWHHRSRRYWMTYQQNAINFSCAVHFRKLY